MLSNFFSKRISAFLLISLVALAIYFPAFSYDFVHLDEDELIIGNQSFISQISHIVEFFKHDVNYPSGFSSYYRPLLTLSFMTDAIWGGSRPFSYHFTNILLHLLSSLLLFVFLEKLKISRLPALFLSLIFAVHPILNQAVSWVPGRNDSLLAIFVFLSFIFFLNFLEKRRRLDFVWHAVFFGLALLTKETAIFLPLLCALYFLLFAKDKLSTSAKICLGIVWLSEIVGWFILRQQALTKITDLSFFSMAEMIFRHLPVLILYLGKIVVPLDLAVLPTLKDSTLIWGGITIALLSGVAIYTKSVISKKIVFGLVWFLLFLLPSLLSYDYATRIVFLEHRVYLPLAGFLIVLSEINWARLWPAKTAVRFSAAAAVILILSGLSLKHNENFKNRTNFWQSAVKTSPHLARAHMGLGTTYALQNLWDQAKAEYLKSLELGPLERKIHNNLGALYATSKEFDKAEMEFKKEIEINPNFFSSYFNLGLVYAKQKRFAEAEKNWLKALELNPLYGPAHQNLAVYYYQISQYDQSVSHINEILRAGGSVIPELMKVRDLYYQGKLP